MRLEESVDLMLQEKQKRRQIVAEMKERKQQGERDQIIVNGMIVKRPVNRSSH